MTITNYDPKKVTVNVGGRIITGFAESSVVTVSANEDRVTPIVGAQGDVVYSENANESGSVVMTLQTTSASLPYLKGLAIGRQETDVLISDANRDTAETVSGSRCRVTKIPDGKKEKPAGSVDITIFIPRLEYRQG